MKLHHRLRAALAVTLLSAVFLTACGGNSSTDTLAPAASTGSVRVHIDLPAASRLLPNAAESVVCFLTVRNGPAFDPLFLNATTGFSGTWTNVPAGAAVLTALVYPTDNGTGTELATGGTQIIVRPAEVSQVVLTLHSEIATFEVTPATVSIAVGESADLIATAKNSSGAVVMLPNLSFWTVARGLGLVSLPAARAVSQYSTTVTGLAEGEATVRIDFEEGSGIVRTAEAVITITPPPFYPGLADTAWPKFRGSAGNTGRSLGSGAAGTMKWEFESGAGIYSSPSIGSDGTIYVGSDDHRLYALNGATGVAAWEFVTGAEVHSSPAIGSDGTVYVGSDDGHVYAVNGATGVMVWQFATGSAVYSSPAIGPDGTVYVGSGGGHVYALNGATGAMVWQFTAGAAVFSSPAIDEGATVFVGSADGQVYALNGATGAMVWQFATTNQVNSSPAIGNDGTVYIGSDNGKVYALDNASGAKLWEFATGGGVYSSPAIGTNGTVYVGSVDGKVHALNGATGAMVWQLDTGDQVNSSPAIGADGTVYVGANNSQLYAIDGATGVTSWEFTTGAPIFSSPAIGADGVVYVGSYDDQVYAIQ